jgi:hypothetical protein
LPVQTLDDSPSHPPRHASLFGVEPSLKVICYARGNGPDIPSISFDPTASLVATLRVDLTARVRVITAIFAVLSLALLQKYPSSTDEATLIPLLFALFGIVLPIGILFDLRRYHVWNSKR